MILDARHWLIGSSLPCHCYTMLHVLSVCGKAVLPVRPCPYLTELSLIKIKHSERKSHPEHTTVTRESTKRFA